MIDDDLMDPEWPDEDDEIVDDEAGRQAAARLRDQLELDLGEPSPAGKANRDDLLEFLDRAKKPTRRRSHNRVELVGRKER